jgi:ABC-type transport system involved in multi-copper enzyme maturation permease subunit
MTSVIRAEVRRLGHWPTMWILGGVWLLLNLTFGYLFPYLTYHSKGTPILLFQMLPDQAGVTLVQGMPLFGGALLMILGALTIGSGYGWGTWKTVFTAGPRRATTLGGTFATLAVAAVALVTVTLGLDLGASYVIAAVEHQAAAFPALATLGQDYGAALLISLMWMFAGALLGTLTRGPALAVGLGLVWALVVENLLRGVASVLGPLRVITDWLPGTGAGSVAGAIGALPQSDPNGTPGVQTILSGSSAAWLLVAYVAVFLALSLGLTVRRDVT